MAENIHSPVEKGFKVTGNLAADPIIKQRKNGQSPVLEMTVFENHQRFDREAGKFVDTGSTKYTISIDTARGDLAQNALVSLRKGQYVTVEGDLMRRPWVRTKDSEGKLLAEPVAEISNQIWADDVSPSLKFASLQAGRSYSQRAGADASTSAQTQQSAQTASAADETPVAPMPDPNHPYVGWPGAQ